MDLTDYEGDVSETQYYIPYESRIYAGHRRSYRVDHKHFFKIDGIDWDK